MLFCYLYTGEDDYLIPGGTAENFHSADKPVTLRDIMNWCYQIARGMEYLSTIGVSQSLAGLNG